MIHDDDATPPIYCLGSHYQLIIYRPLTQMFVRPAAEALSGAPQLWRWLRDVPQTVLWAKLLRPREQQARDSPVLALAHPRLPHPLLLPLLRGLLFCSLEVESQEEGESEPIPCGSAHYCW